MFPSVLWKQTVKFAYEIRIEENRLKIVIFSDFNRFFNRLIDFFDRSIKIDKSIFCIERKTMEHREIELVYGGESSELGIHTQYGLP